MFTEIPATSRSIVNRSLVCGFGTNDAWYNTNTEKGTNREACPYYICWHSMLDRCYSPKIHSKKPTYIGCTTTTEWLIFSNFRQWMETQDWQNKELDKDIILANNKLYSPDTCCFVSRQLNMLLHTNPSKRGEYPQGVSRHSQNKTFIAQLKIRGKTTYLGSFKTPVEALHCYNNARADYIAEIASEQTDPRIKWGLYRHALTYLN